MGNRAGIKAGWGVGAGKRHGVKGWELAMGIGERDWDLGVGGAAMALGFGRVKWSGYIKSGNKKCDGISEV